MLTRKLAIFGVAAMLATLLSPIASQAVALIPGCAPPTHAGGDWRNYGGDLGNTRSQPLETTINAARAAALTVGWKLDLVAAGAAGSIQSTPVIAHGCAFVTTGGGWVLMLNADTGTVLWKKRLIGQGSSLAAEIITGSAAVDDDGVVYVAVSHPGKSYVAALDALNGGNELWRYTFVANPDTFIVAGPVLVNGMIFQGLSGAEAGPIARGAFGIVAAGRTGGQLLKQTWVIDDIDYNEGYRGASVWCTAAADPVARYVYACGGNPASKTREHRYSNALLKIDIDPSRSTFGTIVDGYKGDVDQYYPGLDRQPACEALGEQPPFTQTVWSQPCVQQDLDFGASPSLWRDKNGRQMLSDLQKSGVYHTLFADNMQRSWTTIVGPPCIPCNASSPAVDDATDRMFVASSPGPLMWGLHPNGKYAWMTPLIPGGTHFESVSTANGVVYTVNNLGFLHAVDAATGVLAGVYHVGTDAGAPNAAVSSGSQGVSIARNTVYAASGTTLVAYR